MAHISMYIPDGNTDILQFFAPFSDYVGHNQAIDQQCLPPRSF